MCFLEIKHVTAALLCFHVLLLCFVIIFIWQRRWAEIEGGSERCLVGVYGVVG